MADLKISELPSLGSLVASNDVFVIVDTNNTATKSLTVKDLVGNIPSNTSVAGTLTVSGNTSIGNTLKFTALAGAPSSNNATTVFGANPQGTLAYFGDYLYLAVSNVDAEGSLKRVLFTDFIP
jgi:hypothetical protein